MSKKSLITEVYGLPYLTDIDWGSSSSIKSKDLSEKVKESLLEYLTQWIEEMKDDGEVLNMGDYVISLRRFNKPDERFALAIHERDVPYNPSGQEIFVNSEGEFIGWIES